MNNLERIDIAKDKSILKDKLLKLMPEQGDYSAGFDNMMLHRRHSNNAQYHPIIYQPVIVFIVQGQKSIRIGSDHFVYNNDSYFITSVDLPCACAIHKTSIDHPFLSLSINLDRFLFAQIATEIPPTSFGQQKRTRGAMITELDPELLDLFLRLVELAEKPEQSKILAPLLMKELHYRLLIGPFGNQLYSSNFFGTPSNQVNNSIAWLKNNFAQQFCVESLAKRANMAVSTFHKHFKEITSLSPIQYQKRLRLENAQRLMRNQGYDASKASITVGYESVQQFTREYKRLFGETPKRDIAKMDDLTNK